MVGEKKIYFAHAADINKICSDLFRAIGRYSKLEEAQGFLNDMGYEIDKEQIFRITIEEVSCELKGESE